MGRDIAVSAQEIIERLGLQPHPEGGHYRETFRDPGPAGGRAASTAIYFLLREGERSHWHRVDAAEIWHYYDGAALELSIAERAPRLVRSGSAAIWRQVNVPRWSCRLGCGKARDRSAHLRWSDARWRPAPNSPASSWRRRAGRRVLADKGGLRIGFQRFPKLKYGMSG